MRSLVSVIHVSSLHVADCLSVLCRSCRVFLLHVNVSMIVVCVIIDRSAEEDSELLPGVHVPYLSSHLGE